MTTSVQRWAIWGHRPGDLDPARLVELGTVLADGTNDQIDRLVDRHVSTTGTYVVTTERGEMWLIEVAVKPVPRFSWTFKRAVT